MRNTFASTMLDVGIEDPKLVVLVGDITHYALQPFAKACPGRYYNVGICEPTIVSMAAGLAHAGFHPVVHTIAPFLAERSFEQIKLDFCYQGLGGTIITVGSAFDYSGLGCSHFCYDDLALMKALPDTQVVYPAMPNEFIALFKETYANGKLTYFRIPGEKHGIAIPAGEIRLGKACLVRPGKDITIVAAGPRLKTAVEAAEVLGSAGIDAEVVYPHTVKPFDYAAVRVSVAKTGRFVVMEEHTRYGGIGDEVMRAVQGLEKAKGEFIHIPDRFVRRYGSYADHCEYIGFTTGNLVEKAKFLCQE